MYLTKFIICFAVGLILTLDQSEGRRRWLKRTDEYIGCAESKKLNATIGTVAEENITGLDQDPNNSTQMNNCRFSKWHKLKCRRIKCIEGVSNAEQNVNSTEIASAQNEVPRRTGRRMKCNNHQSNYNQITNNDKASNVTQSELPQSDNEEGQNLRRNRKFSRRFGRRGKCEKSESQANPETNKQSNENTLNKGGFPSLEEAKPI